MIKQIEKDYQKVKNLYLSSVTEYCEFEAEPVNYILIGKFFELLEKLKNAKFEITHSDVYVNAGEEYDMDSSEIEIDKKEYTLSIGVSNYLSFRMETEFNTDMLSSMNFAEAESNKPIDGFFIQIYVENSDKLIEYKLDYKNFDVAYEVIKKAVDTNSATEITQFAESKLGTIKKGV